MDDVAGDLAVDVRHALDIVGDHLGAIPYLLRVVGLCVICATLADDIKDKYLLHFWVTYLAGWGGGLTAALLLNRPLELPVSMFVNYHDIVIVAVWWVANYFPYGAPGYILRLPPIKWACLLPLQMLRAGTMCTVMSMTAKYYPLSSVAVVIMGCIGGSGGKVLHDAVRGGYNIARDTDEVSIPGTSLHGSFIGAVLFYWLVLLNGVLTYKQGHTLVTAVLTVHSLLMEIAGINVLSPIFAVLYTVGNLPRPVRPTAKVVSNFTTGASANSAQSKKQK